MVAHRGDEPPLRPKAAPAGAGNTLFRATDPSGTGRDIAVILLGDVATTIRG